MLHPLRPTRASTGLRLAAMLFFQPLVVGCAGAASDVADPVELDVPSATPTAHARRPRPAPEFAPLTTSKTFPRGLDWLQEPPLDRVPRAPGTATASTRFEAEPLALALGNAVLATGTKLVADGPTIVMRVDEGGEMRVLDPMQTGGCYGVYALGDAGITELDVQIRVEAPPQLAQFEFPVLATDADTGRAATIGFTTGCFKMGVPVALPGVVAVIAKSGAGAVALQLFRSDAESP